MHAVLKAWPVNSVHFRLSVEEAFKYFCLQLSDAILDHRGFSIILPRTWILYYLFSKWHLGFTLH
jgi:hypothetical protein